MRNWFVHLELSAIILIIVEFLFERVVCYVQNHLRLFEALLRFDSSQAVAIKLHS